MNEDVISVIPNQRTQWGVVMHFITQLINKILGPREQAMYSPRQGEFDKAHKMIRMAQNYSEPYEEVVKRIREESLRYQAFKKNPEPIGRVILNVKHLDSNETYQKQYEVKDPAEGKASVSYTHRSSPDTVLEFQLLDKDDLPLFAITRTYCNWTGFKEFDLGGDRVFYLKMVEDERPGHVAIQAGFKDKEAVVPELAFPETTSHTHKAPDSAPDSCALRKMVPVTLTHVAVVLLCCAMFKVIAHTNVPGVESGANQVAAQSKAESVTVPQVTSIVWTNVTPDVASIDGPVGGATSIRHERTTSKPKHAAGIRTFAISVNGASLDESMRCGQELLNRIQQKINAVKIDRPESLNNSNCGNTVKFVVSFEPIERKQTNYLFSPGPENQLSFDDNYEVGQEFIDGADDLANRLFRIMIGHPYQKSGPDNKEDEVAMTQ
jgi:hypothetical protein